MPKEWSKNCDSGAIPGESTSERKERDKHKAQAEGRREKSMASFFLVNCILLSAEDSREGIFKGLDRDLSFLSLSCFFSSSLSSSPSLSLSLSLLSALCLDSSFLFLPLLDILPLQSHDCWEGRRITAWSSHFQNDSWSRLIKVYKYSRYNVSYFYIKAKQNVKKELIFIILSTITSHLTFNIIT